MLLFLSIPRKDVKNLAKELLAYFGSLNKILYADTSLLLQFNGMCPSTLSVLSYLEK